MKGKARRVRSKKQSGSGKKAFIVSLGIGALLGGVFFASKALDSTRTSEVNQEGDTTIYVLPQNTATTSSKGTTGRNDNFPLKYGSLGTRVRQLQGALKRILGAETLARYTKVDGDFRSGTQNALKAAGLPIVVDEATFNRLTSSGTALPEDTIFKPSDLASKLIGFARSKNFDGVMGILSQLKTVNDYSAVNEPFKELQFGASLSIVTYLLDTSFADNSIAKEKIKNEFRRIGLKETDGRWSLSGFRIYKDIITLTNTFVIDKASRKIPVEKNTILGEEISVGNGMTYFKDINHQIHSVPTRDIAYAK